MKLNSKYFWLVGILFWFLLLFLMYLSTAKTIVKNTFNSSLSNTSVTSGKDTKGEYQREIREILVDFEVSYGNASGTAREGIIKTVHDSILKLTVPTEYKDLHVGLILALDQLVKDGSDESNTKTQGLSMFNDIIHRYPELNIASL